MAPLADVLRPPAAAPGAPQPPAVRPVRPRLTIGARRLSRGRLRVTGTAPARAKVRLQVLRGRRVVLRRTVRASATGRYVATLRAVRGKRLRLRASTRGLRALTVLR